MNVNFNKAASAYGNAAKMEVPTGAGDPLAALAGGEETQGPDFGELVGNSLNTAIGNAYKSEGVSAKSLANKSELTDLVTAIGNTELTLNTVVAVRDRVIGAYNDIIKMPI